LLALKVSSKKVSTSFLFWRCILEGELIRERGVKRLQMIAEKKRIGEKERKEKWPRKTRRKRADLGEQISNNSSLFFVPPLAEIGKILLQESVFCVLFPRALLPQITIWQCAWANFTPLLRAWQEMPPHTLTSLSLSDDDVLPFAILLSAPEAFTANKNLAGSCSSRVF